MGRGGESYCQYCGDPLGAGSEFNFLVEALVYDEEVAPLELVQQSLDYQGEPLRSQRRAPWTEPPRSPI